MEIIVFEEEAYWRLQKELINLFMETLKQAKLDRKEDEWISFEEAKKILGYRSKRQWQKLRDSRKVKFTKYGRKIKYLRKSLYEYLEKNSDKL